ncbi:MAG: gamma-glutamyltransferase, partial [Planctomycetaceae bacterium]|nr:gamma-glutamyltransferase [Planctomycetaceae bacterium]
MHSTWLTGCLTLTILCLANVPADGAKVEVSERHSFSHACVAADHPLASEAGAEMLRRGGNVVDAAVATSFALSVVRPESCGIGGGGFLVYWDAAKRQAVAIDYRERAPAAASRDMYLGTDDKPADPRLSQVGGLAVAVPGEVAGLCWVLENYGTLDLPTVLKPAIRLAREGFVVDEMFVEAQRETLDDFKRHPEYVERYAALYEVYLNGGEPFTPGDRFHSPLGKVLELIAQQGANGFHRGAVAEAIVATVKEQGGIITREDFSAQQPVVREPVRGEYAGYEVISMPPPSSGGIAIIETLNILTAFERLHPQMSLTHLGQNDPLAVHVVT